MSAGGEDSVSSRLSLTVTPATTQTGTPTAAPAPIAAAAPTHGTSCANCGAPVTRRYCAECGQRVEHSLHSLRHFIGEAIEDLTHADSRLWRTMAALLLKPGFLTREFLDGRRVSYLPPLRLYLVLSVIFFLITGVASHSDTTRFVYIKPWGADKQLPQKSDESPRQYAERVCSGLNYNGPWSTYLLPRFRASCKQTAEDNGRALTEAYKHTLPRAIFLTLPLLALVMKPLYLRPRRYYVEHVLFLLHNHASLFLVLALFSLLTDVLRLHVLAVPLGFVVALYVPYYYYRAMRRVYGQRTALTLGKLTVLGLAYFITAIFVFAASGVYSALAQ